MPKNKKWALNSGIQTNRILTINDKVCIPSLSSILLANYNKNYNFFSLIKFQQPSSLLTKAE